MHSNNYYDAKAIINMLLAFHKEYWMENLYISLILMAVSGITFIAYRHPQLYERDFSNKILAVSGLIVLSLIMHDSGVSSAFKDLSPYLKDGVNEKVKEVVESASASSELWLLVGFVFFYGLFLSWLADHMKKEKGIDVENEDKPQEG